MRVSKGKEKPPNLNFQNQSSKQADEIRYISVFCIKKLNFKPNVKKSKENYIRLLQTSMEIEPFALWYKCLIMPHLGVLLSVVNLYY